MIKGWGYEPDFAKVLAELDLPVEQLEGKRVLVTGSTGLIGIAFVELLMYLRQEQGISVEVTAASRITDAVMQAFSRYADDAGFAAQRYEMNEPVDAAAFGRFDFVVHCASIANPKWYVERPVDTALLNSDSTRNLLAYCTETGARMVYVSSVEVYGSVDASRNVPLTESSFGSMDPTVVRNSYGESKRFSEQLCVAYAAQHGTDVVIARPAKVYGPSNSAQDVRIMAHMLRAAVRGEDISLNSSGNTDFEFCFVTDAAAALLAISLRGEASQAYNISDHDSIDSLRSVATAVAEAAGVTASFGEDAASATSHGLKFDASKLRSLGWRPLTQLPEGIRKQHAAAAAQTKA